ncbi:MAG: acetylglutamate kinase [Acidobacteriota bacterium]|nr:acetylglutamate kinase [Acidobacteriota bacterium]
MKAERDLGQEMAAALRYASAWRGKRVVIKYGGRAMAGEKFGTLIEDLVLLRTAGLRPMLVHGGGAEISTTLQTMGIEPRFVDGLRVTDKDTMRVVEMVLGGSVNKRLVGMIQRAGGRAVGLTGKDGDLLRVRPHARADELGFVGEIERVDTSLLDQLTNSGYVPVIGSLGVGPGGDTYNVNADTAAAALAAEVAAEKLLLLTDVRGINDNGAFRSRLTPGEAKELIDSGVVSAGMVPKVRACLSAIEAGVGSAHIVAAGEPHGLLVELFTEGGIGTMIKPATQQSLIQGVDLS